MNTSASHHPSAIATSPQTTSAQPLYKPEALLLEALEEYRQALDQGKSIDRTVLLAKYPDIASELAACLDGIDFIEMEVLTNPKDEGNVKDEGQRTKDERSNAEDENE